MKPVRLIVPAAFALCLAALACQKGETTPVESPATAVELRQEAPVPEVAGSPSVAPAASDASASETAPTDSGATAATAAEPAPAAAPAPGAEPAPPSLAEPAAAPMAEPTPALAASSAPAKGQALAVAKPAPAAAAPATAPAATPPAAKPATGAAAKYEAQVMPSTTKTWASKCKSCHGQDGAGKTKTGEKAEVGNMRSAAWQRKFSDAQLREGIVNGFERKTASGAKQKMKPTTGLSPAELDGLVAYVRLFALK